MKVFLTAISFTLVLPAYSFAQDLPAAGTATAPPSDSKFSLPFSIPGLSKNKDTEEPEASEGPSVALPGSEGNPSAVPGTETNSPNSGSLPPGVKPEVGSELEFVQRSNFVLSKIRNNFRQMDPFGMPMDPTNPSESPGLVNQYEEIEEVPVLTNSSLKNALETLPISGIYPKRNVIVIGARSFSRGDLLGMKLEELTIRLRFEGMRGHEIFFKDLDTQEVASVDFSPTPKEFEPITSNNSSPKGDGIVPMDSLFIVN